MAETAEATEEGWAIRVLEASDPAYDRWMVIGPYWDDGTPDCWHDAFDIVIEGKADAMRYANEQAARHPGCTVLVFERPASHLMQRAPAPAASSESPAAAAPAHHTGTLVTATVSLEPGSDSWLIVGPYWGPDGNDAMTKAPAIMIDGEEEAMAYAKDLASNVEGGCRLNVYGRPAPRAAET